MSNFPFVPMEVVERSQYYGGTYFLIQTVSERDGYEVAEVRPDIPWQLKTAQLLSAAPELLEALIDIADDYSERFDMDSPSTNPGMKIVVENARAAIARAKGEKA